MDERCARSLYLITVLATKARGGPTVITQSSFPMKCPDSKRRSYKGAMNIFPYWHFKMS